MKRRVAALLIAMAVGWPACERVADAHPSCPRAGKTACVDRWKGTALRAGWKSAQWPWLRCVIWRESGGNPNAYNRRDPAGGSRGLMQINGIHHDWMRRRGIIRYPSDLYDPYRNLKAAKWLYDMQGRRAWASTWKPC